MKYNEAIDMILDGGRAQPVNSPRWTNRAVWIDLNNDGIIRDFTLSKEDVLAGWIVEKDGVVYEDSRCACPWPNTEDKIKCTALCLKCGYPREVFPPAVADTYAKEIIADGWRRDIPDDFIKVTTYVPSKDLYKIPITEFGYKKLDALLAEGDLFLSDIGTPFERVRSAKLLKSRANDQDEPAELEEGGEPWEKIKMPIIADEVDEDWLEKKMLCFMRRHFLLQPNALQFCKICRDKDCPFCYKKESNEYYICSHGTEPCEECAQKAGLTTKADTVKRPWQENKKFYEQVRSMRGEEDKPKQICTCTQANGHTIACHHCVKRYIDEGVEPKGKTPDGQQILYTRACNHVEGIGGIEKCPICTPIKEQPREKVTEEELADLINTFVSLHIAASLETKPPYKARTQAHDIFLQLKQKLTYLISLQEK